MSKQDQSASDPETELLDRLEEWSRLFKARQRGQERELRIGILEQDIIAEKNHLALGYPSQEEVEGAQSAYETFLEEFKVYHPERLRIFREKQKIREGT